MRQVDAPPFYFITVSFFERNSLDAQFLSVSIDYSRNRYVIALSTRRMRKDVQFIGKKGEVA